MTASTLVETNEPILHLAERAPPKDDRALPSAKPRLSDKRTRIHKDAQPRERTRNPLPSSAGDARPKKVIKYIGAPPPRLLKRMAEIPRSRNQSGSSPNTLDSVARLTTPFRVRSHANAASGSNSRSTDSDPEVRSFLSSLKPSCIDFLHRFTQYGIHDHKALVDLATSPHGLYLFLDGLGETSFKTILLRRALVKLGER
ncbi:hypothetical protein C8Q72DRAFT_841557 [Fomitopsis betulina]|nr:hypothetical protein C8Q72DRAFT_841557 [Fomitopsis betulina]